MFGWHLKRLTVPSTPDCALLTFETSHCALQPIDCAMLAFETSNCAVHPINCSMLALETSYCAVHPIDCAMLAFETSNCAVHPLDCAMLSFETSTCAVHSMTVPRWNLNHLAVPFIEKTVPRCHLNLQSPKCAIHARDSGRKIILHCDVGLWIIFVCRSPNGLCVTGSAIIFTSRPSNRLRLLALMVKLCLF